MSHVDVAPSALASARAYLEKADKLGYLPPDGVIDAAWLETEFSIAGGTLIAMRVTGTKPAGYGSGWPEVVQESIEAYGWDTARIRPPAPSAAAMTHAECVYGWLGFIPEGRKLWRRIVGLRGLTYPLTGDPMYSWRKLGKALGGHAGSVERWHKTALSQLSQAIAKPMETNAANATINLAMIGPQRGKIQNPPRAMSFPTSGKQFPPRYGDPKQGAVVGDQNGNLFLVWSISLGILHTIPLLRLNAPTKTATVIPAQIVVDEDNEMGHAVREKLYAEVSARRHFRIGSVAPYKSSVGDLVPRIAAAINELVKAEQEKERKAVEAKRKRELSSLAR
jgi:hypothetical protein